MYIDAIGDNIRGSSERLHYPIMANGGCLLSQRDIPKSVHDCK